MISFRFAVVPMLVILPYPVLADSPAVVVKQPTEHKICRRVETTGSIMDKRECHTPAEWAQLTIAKRAAQDRSLGLGRDLNGLGKTE